MPARRSMLGALILGLTAISLPIAAATLEPRAMPPGAACRSPLPGPRTLPVRGAPCDTDPLPAPATAPPPPAVPVFECRVSETEGTRNDACPAWESGYHTENDIQYPYGPQMVYNTPSQEWHSSGVTAVSPDGELFYVGIITVRWDTTFIAGRRLPGIAAFRVADGSLAWQRDYEGTPEEPRGTVTGVEVSPDGSTVFLMGYTINTTGSEAHAFVLAFDATSGALLWEARPVEEVGLPYGMAVTADGSQVAITGYAVDPNEPLPGGGGNTETMPTVVLDAGTGEVVWRNDVDGPLGGASGKRIVAAVTVPEEPEDPAFFVTGAELNERLFAGDLITVAYNAEGEQLWTHRFTRDGDQNLEPADLLLTPDGDRLVYKAEVIDHADGTRHTTVVAIDTATGDHAWATDYDLEGHLLVVPTLSGGPGMAIDPRGERVFFTVWVCCETAEVPVLLQDRAYIETIALDVEGGSVAWAERLVDRNRTGRPNSDWGYVVANPTKEQVHVVTSSFDCCYGRRADGQSWAVAATLGASAGDLVSLTRFGDWDQLLAPAQNNVVADTVPFPLGATVTPDGERLLMTSSLVRSIVPFYLVQEHTSVVAWDTPG